MDESKHKHDNCDLLKMVDGMVQEFVSEFGRPPLSLCMGMSLAEHIWEHLRDQMKRDATIKSVMTYRGIPIRIIGFEGACFAELLVEQIPKFRKLVQAQEAEAKAHIERLLRNQDETNH